MTCRDRVSCEQELLTYAQSHHLDKNKLIRQFLLNNESYWSLLEKSMADGLLSVEDKVQLYTCRARMVVDNLKLMKNEHVTDEDSAAFSAVLGLLDEMRQNEEAMPSFV